MQWCIHNRVECIPDFLGILAKNAAFLPENLFFWGVFKACKFTTNLKLFKACNITTNKCRKSIFPVFLQHLLVVKILLQCKILQWFRNVVNTNICYICCNIFRELDLAIFWKWALQPDVGQVASFPWSWCCGRGLRSFSSQAVVLANNLPWATQGVVGADSPL